MSAEKGLTNYAKMLQEGIGTKPNQEEALKFFKIAADKRNKYAAFKYAEMVENSY